MEEGGAIVHLFLFYIDPIDSNIREMFCNIVRILAEAAAGVIERERLLLVSQVWALDAGF